MWKDYLAEAKKKKPNPYANVVSKKSLNRKIIDTKHAIDRTLASRYEENQLTDEMKKLLKDKEKFKDAVYSVIRKAMPIILNKYKDKTGNYGIHSKSTNINVVIDWRLDRKDKTDLRNHAIIVSVLPVKNNAYFKKGDTKIVVECVNGKEELELEAIIEID